MLFEYFVDGPLGIFAVAKCFFQVFEFCFKMFWISCISYHDCTKTVEASKPNTNKWVINLSNTTLTEDQESLLKHGPNFAITPQRPPLEEYIKAIETACQSLDAKSAEELRSDVY